MSDGYDSSRVPSGNANPAETGTGTGASASADSKGGEGADYQTVDGAGTNDFPGSEPLNLNPASSSRSLAPGDTGSITSAGDVQSATSGSAINALAPPEVAPLSPDGHLHAIDANGNRVQTSPEIGLKQSISLVRVYIYTFLCLCVSLSYTRAFTKPSPSPYIHFRCVPL